ncbi:MAG: phage holin family protein [Mangrovibacterium sp.]
MENQGEFIDELVDKGKDFGKTSFEIVKLKTLDKMSDILSNVLSWIPIVLVVFLCFITLNFGIAYLIGQLTDYGDAIGFLIVAAFYLLVALILFAIRKKFVKNPIMDSIILSVMKDDDETLEEK